MASYPSGIPSFTDPTSTDYLNSPAHAALHTQVDGEIVAMATELGTDPAGGYATVKARFEAIEATVATKIGSITGAALELVRYNATSDGIEASGYSPSDFQQAVVAVEDNFSSFDASGFSQDSGYAATDFAASTHNHDTRYYQESEVDAFLAAKEDAGTSAAGIAAHLATHTSSVEHNPFVVGSKTIDETDLADGKIVYFNFATNALVYGDAINVSQEEIEDYVAALIQDGVGPLAWTYDDGAGTLTGNLPQGIDTTDSPTFAGATVSGLTASRLLATDGASSLASVSDLTAWISGTANQITIANDGDGSVTLATPQDIATTSSPTFDHLFLAEYIAHVGDTDNYIQFGTDTQSFYTNNAVRLNITDSAVTVNGPGGDVDFRVETDAEPNAFVVDAGAETATFGVPLQAPTLGVGGAAIGEFSVIDPSFSVAATLRGVDNATLNIEADSPNTGDHDAKIVFEEGTTDRFALGYDGSADNFAITTGATLGGANRLAISTGGAVTFNNAYTFPTADGAGGTFLTTNGAGVLSFAAVPTGVWTDGGTYVYPTSNESVVIGQTATAPTSNEILHVEPNAGGGGAFNANSFITLENNAAAYLEIQTTSTTEGGILFSDDAAANCKMAFDHNVNTYYIQRGNAQFHMSNTEVIVNEGSNDVDFRVEGDTADHLLFCEASTDFVKVLASNVNEAAAGTGGVCIPGSLIVGSRTTTFGKEVQLMIGDTASNTAYAQIGFGYLGVAREFASAVIAFDCTATSGSNVNGSLLFATRELLTDTAPITRYSISNSGVHLWKTDSTAGYQFMDNTDVGGMKIRSTAGNYTLQVDTTGSTATATGTNLGLDINAGSSTAGLPALSASTVGLFRRSTTCGITILCGNTTGTSQINFADTGDENAGNIGYNHTSDSMIFNTNAGTADMTIDSSGLVEHHKGIKQRVVTTTSDTTAVIDVGVTDVYELTAMAGDTTFSFTGTAVDGQKIIVRCKDNGTSRALTWTGFTAIGVTLPAASTASKWIYVGVTYNSSASAWHAIAVSEEA